MGPTIVTLAGGVAVLLGARVGRKTGFAVYVAYLATMAGLVAFTDVFNR